MTTAAATRRSYLPHFERAEKPPPFHITDRDIESIRCVANNRFATVEQLSELLGAPLHKIRDRCKLLYHHEYLDRLRFLRDRHKKGGGSPAHVLALANRGARLLNEVDGTDFKTTEWPSRNFDPDRAYVHHTLEITDT